MSFGVLSSTCKNLLQAYKWTLSVWSNLSIPHNSTPYNKVGTTCASKRLKNISVELQSILFNVARISIVRFLALTAISSTAAKKLSLVEKVSPKYLQEFTTSSLFPLKIHFSLALKNDDVGLHVLGCRVGTQEAPFSETYYLRLV